MADQDDWSSKANEAVEISIVQAGETSPKTLSSFHPLFTYPVFGEEERIFGYQGLKIHLRFAAHDAYPNVEISYDKRFEAVGDTAATNIEEVMKEWIPPISFTKNAYFNNRIQADVSAKHFKPPGKLIESYTSKGRQFEIWLGELTDPGVQVVLERLQIFVSFFIEGGTPLALDDAEWTLARWRVFFVYEKLSQFPSPNGSSYSIVGYSTSYRFVTFVPTSKSGKAQDELSSKKTQTFTLPPSEPIPVSSFPSRARISQFLILPPHQHHSHGSHLYAAVTKTFLASPTCLEITVEDPSEAFDDLRDYCDYTHLLANGTLGQITLSTNLDPKLTAKKRGVRVPTAKILDTALLESLRKKNKLAPRQFHRLVEMHLFSQIAPHARQAGAARLTQRARTSDKDDKAFYYWRLLVKQRVYKKNKDVLMQLDHLDRIDKVEQTVGEVIGDYERLLRRMVEKAVKGEVDEGEGGTSTNGGKRDRAKRKLVIEDDEDEDDAGSSERGRKRNRED
ncbi:MAG: histone acetyltransferase 1 [Heterodermia speciosa]|uniref:Histone acetyltransferase type B catalytic subunit n=1 Tax=Heterodermia speciosa TaxID=116794 RepID=A0A8H3IH76_9LECA|nr:MAG: histone acetyltransferase 1 [Heterodermia speciosa]